MEQDFSEQFLSLPKETRDKKLAKYQEYKSVYDSDPKNQNAYQQVRKYEIEMYGKFINSRMAIKNREKAKNQLPYSFHPKIGTPVGVTSKAEYDKYQEEKKMREIPRSKLYLIEYNQDPPLKKQGCRYTANGKPLIPEKRMKIDGKIFMTDPLKNLCDLSYRSKGSYTKAINKISGADSNAYIVNDIIEEFGKDEIDWENAYDVDLSKLDFPDRNQYTPDGIINIRYSDLSRKSYEEEKKIDRERRIMEERAKLDQEEDKYEGDLNRLLIIQKREQDLEDEIYRMADKFFSAMESKDKKEEQEVLNDEPKKPKSKKKGSNIKIVKTPVEVLDDDEIPLIRNNKMKENSPPDLPSYPLPPVLSSSRSPPESSDELDEDSDMVSSRRKAPLSPRGKTKGKI